MSLIASNIWSPKENSLENPVEQFVEKKSNLEGVKNLTIQDKIIKSKLLEKIIDNREVTSLTLLNCAMNKSTFNVLCRSKNIVVMKGCKMVHKLKDSKPIKDFGYINQFTSPVEFSPDLDWQRGLLPKDLQEQQQLDVPFATYGVVRKTPKNIKEQVKEQLEVMKFWLEEATRLFELREDLLISHVDPRSESFQDFTAYAEAAIKMKSVSDSAQKIIASDLRLKNEEAFLYSLITLIKQLKFDVGRCEGFYNYYISSL